MLYSLPLHDEQPLMTPLVLSNRLLLSEFLLGPRAARQLLAPFLVLWREGNSHLEVLGVTLWQHKLQAFTLFSLKR